MTAMTDLGNLLASVMDDGTDDDQWVREMATKSRQTPADDVDTPTDDDGNALMTTREMAAHLGMTPRRLRRVFRKMGVGCGQGNMYAMPFSQVDELKVRLAG